MKSLNKKTIKKIPVVADDYGISEEINQAIIKQVQLRKVDIVSILSNYIKQEHAIDLKRYLPETNYSIHLNLSRGKPLSNLRKVSSLTDKHGNFYPTYIFILRLLLGRIVERELLLEFQAQILFLKKLGISPNYLDSEQHIHTFSPLWNCITQVCQKNNIQFIRSYRSSELYLRKKPLRWLIFKSLNLVFSLSHKKRVSVSTSYHAFLVHPGTNYDKFSLL